MTLLTDFTVAEVQANCGLGEDCHCVAKSKPWLCAQWGRSQLGHPMVISAYSPNADAIAKGVQHELKLGAEKNAAWNEKTNKRLREIRHEDPRKHLAKKGVTVKR